MNRTVSHRPAGNLVDTDRHLLMNFGASAGLSACAAWACALWIEVPIGSSNLLDAERLIIDLNAIGAVLGAVSLICGGALLMRLCALNGQEILRQKSANELSHNRKG